MILSPWEHIDKVPYAFPLLTFYTSTSSGKTQLTGPLLQNHEPDSIGYLVFFTTLAFLDMRFSMERG